MIENFTLEWNSGNDSNEKNNQTLEKHRALSKLKITLSNTSPNLNAYNANSDFLEWAL